MRYWDSSAIVPLIVAQSYTGQSQGLYSEDAELIVWWGTEIECLSAIVRLERSGDLAVEQVSVSIDRLKYLKEAWNEVQPTVKVKEVTRRLLRVHSLSTADALQLAGAIVVSEFSPSKLPFVCFDKRLSLAASREGFDVIVAK